MLIRITVANRGPEAARLHVLPTIWFRNTWSWGRHEAARPSLRSAGRRRRAHRAATNRTTGRAGSLCEAPPELLFTENETNNRRAVRCRATRLRYVKDGINDYIVHGAPTP